MSSVLLRSTVRQVALAAFHQPRCGLKLKSQGVEYYWRDFPYETGVIPSIFDRAHYRKNENAKSIAVEGNLAVGKETFARNFAALCDLKFVQDVTDDDFYIDKNYKPPLDYRDYNAILPKRFQFYTTEMLYTDSDPIHNGKPLYTQQSYYMYRYYNWWKHCAHVFHTGQGFVTKRSPFSTYIFAKAMAECGYMSQEAADWFVYYDKNLSPTLYWPHLFVYLRSPVSLSADNLRRRGRSWEAGIPDKFLQVMKEVYESEFLPRMQRYSEIFIVDVEDYDFNETNDMQYLAEEICKLDLDKPELLRDLDSKLRQWRRAFYNHDSMQLARESFATGERCLRNLQAVQVPEEMSEGGLTLSETKQMVTILRRDPRLVQWLPQNAAGSVWRLVVGASGEAPFTFRATYDEDFLKLLLLSRNTGTLRSTIGSPDPTHNYRA